METFQEGNFEKDALAANGKERQNLIHALLWRSFLKSSCFDKMLGSSVLKTRQLES